eukprot:gene11403-19557_t
MSGKPTAPFRLTVEDVLAISDALMDAAAPISMLLPSTGTELELFTSKNGCRRCDVHVEVEDDDTERKDGWMKLMEQNVGKSSAAAARARAGAKIVHILPLYPDGKHLSTNCWGLVEDGAIAKNSKVALSLKDENAVLKDENAALKRRIAELEGEADAALKGGKKGRKKARA